MGTSVLEEKGLKELGLRATVPRLKILELLSQFQDRHWSADDIFQRLREGGDEVGYATIYRVLAQFEASGLIRRHRFEGDRALYELNDREHHDHLICLDCGKVEEFYDEIIETRQESIAQSRGFSISHHQLVMYGLCGACGL